MDMGRGWTYVQRPTGYSARLANHAPRHRIILRELTGRERLAFGVGGVVAELPARRLKRPVRRDFIIFGPKAILAYRIARFEPLAATR